MLGRLLGDTPEVALRGGAYGHWLPVPWEAVFEGNRGVFRDVAFDPPPPDDPAGTGDGDDGPALPAEVEIARALRRALWPVRGRPPWPSRAHPRTSRSERA